MFPRAFGPDGSTARRYPERSSTSGCLRCSLRALAWSRVWRTQPRDPVEDATEELAWHSHLRHLEDRVPAVGDYLRADLDHLLSQRGQGPLRDLARQGQRAREVGEVVGERVELETHGVASDGRARQPRPLDGVLPLLDPLFGRPAPIVEGDDLLGRATQVRHDEADTRVQLAGVPLHFRDDATCSTPALRPITEAREEASDVLRGATDGPREEPRDLRLKQLVGGQRNGVLEALRLQVLVYVREREGRIAAQQASDGLATIAGDHGIEHVAPAVRAVHIARPQRAPLQVAVLVEHEERMVSGGGHPRWQLSTPPHRRTPNRRRLVSGRVAAPRGVVPKSRAASCILRKSWAPRIPT